MTESLAQADANTPLSLGSMTINHEIANGGTFTSHFDAIYGELYVDDPLNGMYMGTHAIELSGQGVWTNQTSCWGDPSLSNGGFCIQDIEHTGPHPAVVPEPTTLALFGAGFAFLGLRRRRSIAA